MHTYFQFLFIFLDSTKYHFATTEPTIVCRALFSHYSSHCVYIDLSIYMYVWLYMHMVNAAILKTNICYLQANKSLLYILKATFECYFLFIYFTHLYTTTRQQTHRQFLYIYVSKIVYYKSNNSGIYCRNLLWK